MENRDKKLSQDIKRARVLLVIYGVFGLAFGIYIFANYIYGFFHTEALAIILLPMAFAFTLACIFGGLKEFTAAAQLQENVLLAARTGILGQVLIGIPSSLFVYGMLFEYTIITYAIPLIWLFYNPILFFNLQSLKKSSQINKSQVTNK